MNKTLKKSFMIFFTIFLLVALAACGGGDKEKGGESKEGDNGKKPGQSVKSYSIDDFKKTKDNKGEAIEGGEITVALVSSTAFEGTLNHLFQTMTSDSTLLGWFTEPLLEIDENSLYTNDGPATLERSEDQKVWTIKIKDNVNWHDGKPVTAEDLEYAYLLLGHPEYDGPWYGNTVKNIEGMVEYNEGKSESISGIKIIDEKTIELNFIEPHPFMFIWGNPVPKHIFKDIPVTEIASSPYVRQHPIGFGPFKVDRIIPGEQVIYKKNEDYWRGEVQLDQVTVKVIDSSTVVQEIKSGGVDIAGFPSSQLPENDNLTNVEFLADVGNTVTYIGFRLGEQDPDTLEVKPDPNSKMADKRLRKAMWHAIDPQLVIDTFYHGLAFRGTTLISPYSGEFHDKDNPGLQYDPEKANELLDEAGFEWKDGEKFRTGPDGEEFKLILAAYQGGDTAEPITKYYIQSWAKVGINVELLDGRLQELNTYYDLLKNKEGDRFDMYLAQLGLGSSPDPAIFKGPTSIYNYARWQDDRANELLEAGRSSKAFDLDFLKETYDEWQALMVEEVPEFPVMYSVSMTAVNNRVLNYSIDPAVKLYRYQIAVSSDKPEVDGK